MSDTPDYKTLLFQLIGSLTLCDHMGDAADGVDHVLKKLGVTVEDEGDWWSQVGAAMHERGYTTLYGTSLGDEE